MTKKDDKVYDRFEIDFSLRDTSRKALRDKVVQKFLCEEGGFWKGGVKHVTMYKYFVEKLKDGRRIFILRPTYLNKGIDFQVWVEKMTDHKDERPSHKDIFKDLEIKKKENSEDFPLLISAIDKVWNCEEPDVVLKETKLNFRQGFSPELLLKILKWLFIEQDITYWNYDGRGMLKMAIDSRAKTTLDSLQK
jgi:hypothetical protein